MMKASLFFIFFIISGCALFKDTSLKPRTLENYYVSTGVEKYFLTDIPNWANFDQKAGCYRSQSIRYFDLNALMKSYAITYNKALQMQAAFNEEYTHLKLTIGNRPPNLKEEELLFYKVSEKVSNKIIFFDPPTFNKVNLIWFDEIVGDQKKEKKLRDFLRSPISESAVPVLISFCHTRFEIEKKYPDINEKMITAEMLSIFKSSGEAGVAFQIEVDQFFSSDQKINFYSQKNFDPSEVIKGFTKATNY